MSRFTRKVKTLVPMVGLVALLAAAILVGNLAPPAVVHSLPENGADCYCHKGLARPVDANGTTVDTFVARVGAGKSFTMLVRGYFAPDPLKSTIISTAMEWVPDQDDNVKFKFDPTKVVDNSPQDRNSTVGTIEALFKITAPNEPGSYQIVLSYQETSSLILVNVGGQQPGSSSFAAISYVKAPVTAKAGDLVRMNITLRNSDLGPSKLYAYATDSLGGQVIFAKVYSETPVAGNTTITLSGAFEMPNGTLSLMIHSGHVQDNVDFDDDRLPIAILLLLHQPPIQRVSFDVLAKQWVPWVAVIAASLSSVQIAKSFDGRRKRLAIGKTGKLKLAVVDCALCGGCEIAMADLGEDLLNLLSSHFDLVYAPILMSAREYGPVDVAFVVGSVRTEEDIRAVKEAREKAKVLVAFGTCPIFGGLHYLANLYSNDELLEYAYRDALSMEPNGNKTLPSEHVPELANKVKPLSDYVKVDLSIPGCPPPLPVIRSAIDAVIYEFASRGKSKCGKEHWKLDRSHGSRAT